MYCNTRVLLGLTTHLRVSSALQPSVFPCRITPIFCVLKFQVRSSSNHRFVGLPLGLFPHWSSPLQGRRSSQLLVRLFGGLACPNHCGLYAIGLSRRLSFHASSFQLVAVLSNTSPTPYSQGIVTASPLLLTERPRID